MTEMKWADESYHKRELEKAAPRSRRRCPCCKRRATHMGTANGIGLMMGCEIRVRRWVRDGARAAK